MEKKEIQNVLQYVKRRVILIHRFIVYICCCSLVSRVRVVVATHRMNQLDFGFACMWLTDCMEKRYKGIKKKSRGRERAARRGD